MRNTSLSLEEAKQFFNTSSTPENTAAFFKNGFPEILLKNNHFISLLKRKSVWDKTGVLLILDYTQDFLPTLLQTQYDFHQFFYSLDNEILSYLFSKAPFIQERFLQSLTLFLRWMQDARYSLDHRFFLMSYYEKYFIKLVENNLTLGALARLLSIFNLLNEKYNEWITIFFQNFKSQIIELFKNKDLIPYIYIFLNLISSCELTLLFQQIPGCFNALKDLSIKPAFFTPFIEHGKLAPDLQEPLQLR